MKEYIESLSGLSHKQLVLMLARQRLRESEGIAVTGLACRLPGGLDSPRQYWEALRDGRVVAGGGGIPVDSTGRPRWNVAAPDLAHLAGLLGQGSYLADIDLFDAERFGIGEEEAAFMDPQQRLLLTVAAEALQDAGAAPGTDARVGVFAGVSTVEYNYACLRNGVGPEGLSPYMGTGGALSATAARVATGLRLGGPVLTVDTACSSALTALHLASHALRARECDLAVVGACHLLLAPFTTAVFAQAGMVSPTGRSRPFDAAADGHVRGEGCGVLVLKRQSDARADGDVPYAVVRGSGIHQHGDRPAMAAASALGQRRVIADTLRSAGIDPHAVHYVEAQANGSKLGGVIEAETLAGVYGRDTADAPELLVGSAKGTLGYLETASGAAGLIKAVLALNHRTVPVQPGFDVPDPAIPWQRMALRVPTASQAWPDAPRRLAGVSAFGFTGTNAHVLMEGVDGPPRQAPGPAPVRGRRYWPEGNQWT
ncbi:polyketide synthase [Streptomyces virginiae]|uniref:beta-ketoacyl [acyl carrier protein] synthase domain-containing protein n=1 Tax=Streptomyces virginiae TaxID=1961 RepID=UPI002DBAD01A|nr:polyketide synthase [Streptomyces sp. CMAA1738]MEC4571638.1 polyketide synthase [Streptomyces sp. CMAA1738]